MFCSARNVFLTILDSVEYPEHKSRRFLLRISFSDLIPQLIIGRNGRSVTASPHRESDEMKLEDISFCKFSFWLSWAQQEVRTCIISSVDFPSLSLSSTWPLQKFWISGRWEVGKDKILFIVPVQFSQFPTQLCSDLKYEELTSVLFYSSFPFLSIYISFPFTKPQLETKSPSPALCQSPPSPCSLEVLCCCLVLNLCQSPATNTLSQVNTIKMRRCWVLELLNYFQIISLKVSPWSWYWVQDNRWLLSQLTPLLLSQLKENSTLSRY